MREWTEIGFSSIYYLLKKLEQKKLITSRTEISAGRGPARKVYRITVKGNKSCHDETLDVLEIPHRCYPPLQLGLANFPIVQTSVALDALSKHHLGLIEHLRHIQSHKEQQQPLPYFVEAMFDYSLTVVDGHGGPNTAQTYKEAVEGLYAVAYKLKFMSKKAWAMTTFFHP